MTGAAATAGAVLGLGIAGRAPFSIWSCCAEAAMTWSRLAFAPLAWALFRSQSSVHANNYRVDGGAQVLLGEVDEDGGAVARARTKHVAIGAPEGQHRGACLTS